MQTTNHNCTILKLDSSESKLHGCVIMMFCRGDCRDHYANMPMQYTAIFHGCKNVHFQMNFLNIFLIFAQNIDRGYTLEPPHLGGSNEYPLSMF